MLRESIFVLIRTQKYFGPTVAHGHRSRYQQPREFPLKVKWRLRRLSWEGLRTRVWQVRGCSTKPRWASV